MAIIEPHYPKARKRRRSYKLMVMLRIHVVQQWFGYSDSGMEEALHEVPLLRKLLNWMWEWTRCWTRAPYSTFATLGKAWINSKAV